MKKKFFLLSIIILVFLAVGCSKDEAIGEKELLNTEMSVSIEGATTTRAVGTPTQAEENAVYSFTVYVFNNSTGVLEASETFTNGLTGTITGLGVASKKKVVVLVNRPSNYPTISSYADFSNAASMIDLETQVLNAENSQGLFMSGQAEEPLTLSVSDPSKNKVTITVKRVTAKVKLGALTVTPSAGLSLDKFVLTGVSVQRARDKADVFGLLRTTGFDYVGGVSSLGSALAQVDYLNELYALPENYTSGSALSPNIYFYVFPNDNTDGVSTLLNIYGSYDGKTLHYPFEINSKASTENGDSTDGNWIQPNKVYALNVTLRKIASGGDNPDVPNDEVGMEVTVTVANWEGELTQNVAW